jgi:hypothetical protein
MGREADHQIRALLWRHRQLMITIVAALTFALLSAASTPAERTVLFSIIADRRGAVIQPIVMGEPFEAPPSGQYHGLTFEERYRMPVKKGQTLPFHEAAANCFADRYFRYGRTYALVGIEGKATIGEVFPLSCESMSALVSVSPASAIKKSNDPWAEPAVLATNRPGLHLLETAPASAAAQTMALDHARVSLQASGATRHDLTTLRSEIRTIDVGDGTTRIVASFRARQHDQSPETVGIHQLFLVGRWREGRLIWETHLAGMLIAAVDLDGDGLAELITHEYGLESQGYSVLTLKKGVWQHIAGGSIGC